MTKSRDLANAATALNAVTATELGFVDGVTSAIQTQLDAKATLTGTETLTNKTLTSPVLTTPTISTVNAKGDLLVGTADNTVDRLAVGSNGDTIVADSSTSTGLRYQGNFAAGKNKIINGDFGIWQRGTTFTNPGSSSSVYTSDRWFLGYADANPTSNSITRQSFTAGAAPVAGYESSFFIQSTITTLGSTTIYRPISQKIEDVRTFAGQTMTVSFWAKTDSTRTITLGSQQLFGSGGSADVELTYLTFTGTTSWQRFSGQVSVPSISGKTIGTGSALNVFFQQAAASGSVLDVWGVQVEAGSVATAFQTATGTIQGELAACQRYYRRLNAGTAYGTFKGVGVCTSTTKAELVISLDIELRTNPSFASSGSFQVVNGGASTNTTSLASGQLNTTSPQIEANVASGLTIGFGAYLRSNNSTASYLEFSAEL